MKGRINEPIYPYYYDSGAVWVGGLGRSANLVSDILMNVLTVISNCEGFVESQTYGDYEREREREREREFLYTYIKC